MAGPNADGYEGGESTGYRRGIISCAVGVPRSFFGMVHCFEAWSSRPDVVPRGPTMPHALIKRPHACRLYFVAYASIASGVRNRHAHKPDPNIRINERCCRQMNLWRGWHRRMWHSCTTGPRP